MKKEKMKQICNYFMKGLLLCALVDVYKRQILLYRRISGKCRIYQCNAWKVL